MDSCVWSPCTIGVRSRFPHFIILARYSRIFFVTVDTIVVETMPNTTIVEGQTFTVPPSVLVTNSAGAPVPLQTVYAMLTMSAGIDMFLYSSVPLYGSLKYLVGFSSITDSSGRFSSSLILCLFL